MVSIGCLFGRHTWKFSYNRGISLATKMSLTDTLELFKEGKAYGVDRCTRCGRQSRLINGQRVFLARNDEEEP